MNYACRKEMRVLAIDPSTRGFGFCVLEGADRLIDCGTRSARENKNRKCLRKVGELIEYYRPDVLVVENCVAEGSRRCARVRRLVDAVAALATGRKIRVRRISRRHVQLVFSESNGATKHEIAMVIAKRFPELAPHLPPMRRAWMSEDCRMQIFGAVGPGVSFFRKRSDPTGTKVYGKSTLQLGRHGTSSG